MFSNRLQPARFGFPIIVLPTQTPISQLVSIGPPFFFALPPLPSSLIPSPPGPCPPDFFSVFFSSFFFSYYLSSLFSFFCSITRSFFSLFASRTLETSSSLKYDTTYRERVRFFISSLLYGVMSSCFVDKIFCDTNVQFSRSTICLSFMPK